jgi:hypothetical protein
MQSPPPPPAFSFPLINEDLPGRAAVYFVIRFFCQPPSMLQPATSQSGTTGTGDFQCREVKTGFCQKKLMQTGSSQTLIGWKSDQTTYLPLWDRMEGAWLWTQARLHVVPGQTSRYVHYVG